MEYGALGICSVSVLLIQIVIMCICLIAGPVEPVTVDPENLQSVQSRHLRNMAERDQAAMEAATRAMEEATKRMEEAARPSPRMPTEMPPKANTPNGNRETSSASSTSGSIKSEEPPMKRPVTEEDRLMAHVGVPSAHIKITGRSKYHL